MDFVIHFLFNELHKALETKANCNSHCLGCGTDGSDCAGANSNSYAKLATKVDALHHDYYNTEDEARAAT